MKNTRIIFVLMGFLIEITCYGQNDSIFNDNYIRIATLKVDYETYTFEGGNLSYYLCPNCPADSIPFTIIFEDPADFGCITFKLASFQDTIFDASIIWMGIGQINYPNEFSTSVPFVYSDSTINKPNDMRYLEYYGYETTNTNFIEKADSAWNSINSLEITSSFAENNFESAIYKYPPRVGIFDPSVAKWIIFLYQTKFTSSSEQEIPNSEKDLTVYPNPATTQISLNAKTGGVVSVYTMQGQKMLSSRHHPNSKQTINISRLSKGLYVIKFESDTGAVAIEKLVVW